MTAALALLSMAAGPQTAESLLVLRSGWAYVRSGGSERRLFAADAAACSPDGRQIAYTSSRALVVYDTLKRERRTLVSESAPVSQPCWSPKGDWIAFESGHGAVDLIRPDGSGRRRVLSQSFVFGLAWSPDGVSVVFHDNQTLHGVSIAGEAVFSTALAEIAGAPDVVSSTDTFLPSPSDPDQWLFTRAVPGTPLFDSIFHEPNSALFLYNSKTGHRRRLSPPELLVKDPVWSRDGHHVYLAGYYDRSGRARNPFRIWRIDVLGGEIVDLGVGDRVTPNCP